MMIVMKPTATEDQVQAVIDRIESVGAHAHPSRGEEVTVIGAIGDREHVARLGLESQEGVEKVVPILKPYKLASTQLRGVRQISPGKLVKPNGIVGGGSGWAPAAGASGP